MAATDQQIKILGNEAVPASWPLPSSLVLGPKAVFASYDGSSAASSFLPTLTILSDSGDVIGRYRGSTAVAAGGSADVSWAPFLRDEAAAAASSTSLPYCDIGQRRANFNPGIATQFRWTNVAGRLERNDPMFDYADANTALSINSEGVFAIQVFGSISLGNSGLTSDRIVEFEYDTGSGYTPFGSFDTQGPLVTGQPALAATPASYFSEYTAMVSYGYWVGTLASTGLGALPLKVRPVMDVNNGLSNPATTTLSMFVTRIGDAPVFV